MGTRNGSGKWAALIDQAKLLEEIKAPLLTRENDTMRRKENRGWQFLLFVALMVVLSMARAANGMEFEFFPMEGSAKGRVEKIPNGFRLTMESTPGSKGFAMAGAKIDTTITITPKQKIRFRWRGGSINQATTFGMLIIYKNPRTGESKWRPYRVGSADGSFWRTVTVGFDKFHLPLGSYELTSFRFGVTGKDNPQPRTSIDITDLAIIDEDELSLAQADFLVVPAKKRVQKKQADTVGFRMVKVYFDFDNNDFRILLTKRHEKPVYEKTADAGFRDLVLENCEGVIQRVGSPDIADVIVYSRAAPGPNGPAIAEAVRRGAGLVVYGNVPDSDVASLLPAEVNVRKINGLPERQTVAKSDLPIFGGIKFNDVDFGVYLDLQPCQGAKTLLSYADGRLLALEKGNILQYGVGIGTTLLPSEVFYDKLLLHSILWCGSPSPVKAIGVLSEHEKKVKSRLESEERAFVESVTDAAGIFRQDSGKYHRGASHENIGRFGYYIEEGLPCDNIDPSLKVTWKGIQGYTFDVVRRKAVPLKRWKVKEISGEVTFPRPNVTELDFGEIWQGLGKVEYRCQLEMKPEWKGKVLFLEVRDGISGCDEAWFNGHRIGGVSKNVTNYRSHPRRYAIAEESVEWGKTSELRVVIENLHEGACFNSQPELVIASGATRELAVPDINWIYKQYEVVSSGGTHRVSLNAVTPFILYDFSQNRAEMTVENVAECAAYTSAAGVKAVNLLDNDTLYDIQRDGALVAPWILLYRSGETSPLMLALSRNISTIRVERFRGDVEKLIFDGGENALGEIAVGRPWGMSMVDTSGWQKTLPEDAVKKVKDALDMAFNFPVACDEIYHVDQDKRDVEIVNRFRFHRVEDEWNTPCSPYAILPPVVAFAVKDGILGSCGEKPSDFSMNTKFGPLLGTRGKDTIRYSLPLPDRIDPVLPEVASTGNELFRKAINECAIGGCQQSFAQYRVDAFSPAQPVGPNLPSSNCCPFSWQMDMGVLLDGYFQFNYAAKNAADERIRKRILEPMELYRYKNFGASRVEPYSGIEYTANFRSIYPNPVNYAPGFGTKLILGDCNEVYAQTAWITVMMADRLGYARQARNAWPHYKYLARYNKCIDDWAFQSSSCKEYGVGGWMDMLNCEYPALYYHVRLAEIAGDRRELDNALYRTAKKMVPTLTRFWFGSYLYASQLIPGNINVAVGLGFNEYDGVKYYTVPIKGDRFFKSAVDIFDFSRGFPGALSHLYRQRALPEIEDYITKQAIPALFDETGKFDSLSYLTVLSQFCGPDTPLERYATEVLEKHEEKYRSQRAGMCLGTVLGNVQAWRHQVPRLRIANDVAFHKCSFDVRTRQLTLAFTGNSAASKIVIPEPESITVRGREIAKSTWKRVNGGVLLPIADGNNDLVAQY